LVFRRAFFQIRRVEIGPAGEHTVFGRSGRALRLVGGEFAQDSQPDPSLREAERGCERIDAGLLAAALPSSFIQRSLRQHEFCEAGRSFFWDRGDVLAERRKLASAKGLGGPTLSAGRARAERPAAAVPAAVAPSGPAVREVGLSVAPAGAWCPGGAIAPARAPAG